MAVATAKFTDPLTQTLAIKSVNAASGKSTLSFPDGTVASCQPPDGVMGFRPAGTAGDYELCDVDGNVATFWPDHATDKRYTFAFVKVTA